MVQLLRVSTVTGLRLYLGMPFQRYLAFRLRVYDSRASLNISAVDIADFNDIANRFMRDFSAESAIERLQMLRTSRRQSRDFPQKFGKIEILKLIVHQFYD
jgi:hypothetical protein